ncbi:MAG: hypothetical protein [Bacteriophage sp.]|nr:MAG: hypothetical protein [Bacteriophage sp.]
MKTVYKKAISLANKNGQNFIKEMAAYYTYIGIEEGNISNWFVLIAKSKETGKYICLSISRYDSGGAVSTFYGDLKHFCLQKAENTCYRFCSCIRFWLRANLIWAYEKQIKAKYNIKF